MQTLRRVRVIVISVLCTLCLACKKEPPPAVHIPTLALTAVDASCTEAWLKLTTTQLPASVRLVRLTRTLQTLQLSTPDTLLIQEGLLPNHTYTYKAYRLEPQTPNPAGVQCECLFYDRDGNHCAIFSKSLTYDNDLSQCKRK
jgi:Fe-S-cluster containining protein